MKISLCQVNPILGDLSYNKNLILRNYNKAIKKGADIVVFPELVVTGYPPMDLLNSEQFITDNLYVVNEIASYATIPIIFGFIRLEKNKKYNSAAICGNKKILYTYDKILLPNYDVFDEKRYFHPGLSPGVFTLKIKNKSTKVGVQICEDLWGDENIQDITQAQKGLGAECIINISASPYSHNKIEKRFKKVLDKALKNKIPFYYCNLVGSQDELIFDGTSFFISREGFLINQLPSFKEHNEILDTNTKLKIESNFTSNEENTFNALCLGIKDYFYKTGFKKALVGLSGGIDSALVATITALALGKENISGIALPSKYSSKHSLDDAKALSENLNINFEVISIENMIEQFDNLFYEKFKDTKKNIAEENLQARTRGNILMTLANKFNYLLLTTGNKTELALGYCTLYGDMSGSLSVISDLNKVEVYNLSKWINNTFGNLIPENSILKKPSAELSENQVDPFDYDIIAPLVDDIISQDFTFNELVEKGYEQSEVIKIYNIIKNNEYKRNQAALGFKVSNKAFGIGRRMPIINRYTENKL